MLKNKRFLVSFILLALLPLALVAIFYSRLPRQIPMHWGLDGQISFEDKAQLWLVAGLSPVIAILMLFLPKIDPLKKNYERFAGAYSSFCLVFELFMTLITSILLVEGFHPGALSVEQLVIGALGLLFVFTGNMMPKIKNNYFIGFRTPWALSNPDVWNKTQRLGGYCFCVTGLVSLLLALLPLSSELRLGALLGVLTITCILPTIMSCYWFQKLPKSQQKKKLVVKNPPRR